MNQSSIGELGTITLDGGSSWPLSDWRLDFEETNPENWSGWFYFPYWLIPNVESQATIEFIDDDPTLSSIGRVILTKKEPAVSKNPSGPRVRAFWRFKGISELKRRPR